MPERRQEMRMVADKSATIEIVGTNQRLRCRVIDLSLGGACLECDGVSRPPDQFKIVLDAYYSASCQVMWRNASRLGIAFRALAHS
jgi:hypothetical protein